MRFHRLALTTAAVVALSSFDRFNSAGLVRAEDAVPATDAVEATGEKFEFQAEVSRVLDIVVNSLYQNKDVFLRELISNASDALDKVRFLSITKPELLEGKAELEVRISYDADAHTLTVTDSGIGMTKADLIANLGTVARSGTTKFMDALSEGDADISQIGMFGVGFYSAFLVADKVTVASKNPTEDTQYLWSSDNGSSSFSIAEDPRGNSLGRGTEITLHLKEDAEEYADYFKLNTMVKHYSEFITHPIYLRKTETVEVPDEDEDEDIDAEESSDDEELDVSESEEEDDEPKEPKMKEVTTHTWEKSNADTALWYRSKDDISDDEYQEFYKMIAKDSKNATAWSHFDAEGNINFKSLVYIPTEVPQKMKTGDYAKVNSEMKLYVRKVLISDEFELLPKYLSFVKGVIDSDDLPLNVNRETLQESKIISIIKKKTTRKCIDMIKKLADGEKSEDDEEKEVEIDEDGNVIEQEEEDKPDKYIPWYENFGPSLKMGIIEDEANRKKLAKLIRIKTSKSDGEYTTFESYVDGMKEWQKEIFFIAGVDEDELKKSPFMEKFFEKDVEVIYFTEPIDEYMIQTLQEFDGKKFSTITKETVNFGDEDEDLDRRISAAYKDKYDPLVKFMMKFYGKALFRTQISKRLGSVPAIVSSSEFGHSANMERIMRSQVYSHSKTDDSMRGLRTMELNPRHPIVEKILSQIPEPDEEGDYTSVIGDVSQELKDTLWTLLDTALLNGGFPINEGKAFTRRMTRVLQSQLALDTLELLPEIEPAVDVEPPLDVELEDGDGLNMDDFDFEPAEDLDEFEE